MSWQQIFEQWPLLEADLMDIRVDVGDAALMGSRSWRWFESKVTGLFSKPATGFVKVADPDDEHRVLVKPIYGTRLQTHFFAS